MGLTLESRAHCFFTCCVVVEPLMSFYSQHFYSLLKTWDCVCGQRTHLTTAWELGSIGGFVTSSPRDV